MSLLQKRPGRTLGPGHDTFWGYCAERELRLQRCGACEKFAWPVVPACEHCGSADLRWERCSGRGRLVSWSTFERDYYQGVIPIPYDNILVELEEGPLFLSNPAGFTWAEAKPGMAVQVAFVACEDAAGRFELPVFEKA
jgi:uncharacterized OB-fold protein